MWIPFVFFFLFVPFFSLHSRYNRYKLFILLLYYDIQIKKYTNLTLSGSLSLLAERLIGSRIYSLTGIFPPCAGGNIFFLKALYQRMETLESPSRHEFESRMYNIFILFLARMIIKFRKLIIEWRKGWKEKKRIQHTHHKDGRRSWPPGWWGAGQIQTVLRNLSQSAPRHNWQSISQTFCFSTVVDPHWFQCGSRSRFFYQFGSGSRSDFAVSKRYIFDENHPLRRKWVIKNTYVPYVHTKAFLKSWKSG